MLRMGLPTGNIVGFWSFPGQLCSQRGCLPLVEQVPGTGWRVVGTALRPPPCPPAVLPVRDRRWRRVPKVRLTRLSSGGGHIKEVIVAAEAEPGDGEMAEAPGSPSCQGPAVSGEGEQAQVKLLVNEDGRYVCVLCHKTFKTVSPGAACGSGLLLLLPRQAPEPHLSPPPRAASSRPTWSPTAAARTTSASCVGPPSGPRVRSSGTTGGTPVSQAGAGGRTACCQWLWWCPGL